MEQNTPRNSSEQLKSKVRREFVSADAPRVLIVEDCALTGLAMAELLKESGFTPLGPAADLRSAEEIVNSEEVHAALLDIGLGNENSFNFALDLKERGISFAFLSGFDPDYVLPSGLQDSAFLDKPFKDAQLVACLGELLKRSPRPSYSETRVTSAAEAE